MNQNKSIDVLYNIKRIRIADNVFGKKSREKLQAIVDEEYMQNLLLEDISYSENNKEAIQIEIMDNVISSILKEAVTKAVKLNVEQLTDELIESVITYQTVLSAISEAKCKMARIAKFAMY